MDDALVVGGPRDGDRIPCTELIAYFHFRDAARSSLGNIIPHHLHRFLVDGAEFRFYAPATYTQRMVMERLCAVYAAAVARGGV